ncbi:MAG TPA: carboxypeptidase-like regulatory domain-containing protein, partial [Bryobacteraceae bacterium]|nr:carboxypeptidase-like regulatory domain-containing protein [Bryobacteraceae bacterium]
MSTFHVVRVLSLSVLLAASDPLYTTRAQTPSGQIFGVVTDPSATAVAGASITVQNETTNQQRVLTSGTAGDYVAGQLAPGRYRLTVRHPGFKAAVVSNLELQALQNLRSDVQLSLGELAESVTVVSENIQVDTRGSSAGLLVDDKRVRE